MTPVSVNIHEFGAVEVRAMRFRQGTFRTLEPSRGERKVAKEVEDGRFSSRVARDIGGLCHGESIDAVG